MKRTFQRMILLAALMALAALEIPGQVELAGGVNETTMQSKDSIMQEKYERFNEIIARLVRYQQELGLNDSQFVTRFRKFIGSPKTWRERLVGQKWESFGANLPTWERRLEAFLVEIDGGSAVEDYYAEMPLSKAMTEIYYLLQEQRSDRRCAVCLAETGTGKSAWARWIVNRHPREACYVRANESWRDSLAQIVCGIGGAVGANLDAIVSTAGKLRGLIETLKMSPITIIIDEAHEGGVLLFKAIKTLIDESKAKFILLSFPTTWQRVLRATDDARAEARQLVGRTLKPVYEDYRSGIDLEAVAVYLRKAGLDGEAKALASKLLPILRSNGNLRLLADAVEAAQLEADATDAALSAGIITGHLNRLCPVKDGRTGKERS